MPPVKNVGKPCAGEPHARFDGRGLETEATPAMVEAKAARGETPAGAPDLQPNHSPPRQPPTLLDRDHCVFAALVVALAGSVLVSSSPGGPAQQAGQGRWAPRSRASKSRRNSLTVNMISPSGSSPSPPPTNATAARGVLLSWCGPM